MGVLYTPVTVPKMEMFLLIDFGSEPNVWFKHAHFSHYQSAALLPRHVLSYLKILEQTVTALY